METNIHAILSMKYSEELFKSSSDACDYIEVYDEETTRIQDILKKLSPRLACTYGIIAGFNIFFDNLPWNCCTR